MRFIWIIMNLIQEALNQIFGSYNSTPGELYFTQWAEKEMLEWGISQSDVREVFHKGTPSKKKVNTNYKKYGNYWIFIKYRYTQQGNPEITRAWKWDGK